MQNNLQITQSKQIDDKALWAIADRTEKQVQAADSKFERMLDENKQRQSQNNNVRATAAAKENEINKQTQQAQQQDQKTQSQNEQGRVASSQNVEHAQNIRDEKSTAETPFVSMADETAANSGEQAVSTADDTTDGLSEKPVSESTNFDSANDKPFLTGPTEQQAFKISSSDQNAQQSNDFFRQLKNVDNAQQSQTMTKVADETEISSSELANNPIAADLSKPPSAENVAVELQSTITKDLKSDAEKLEQSLKAISTNDKTNWLDGIMQLANQNANQSSDENALSKSVVAKHITESQTSEQSELDEFAKLIASFKNVAATENADTVSEGDAQLTTDKASRSATALDEQLQAVNLTEAEIKAAKKQSILNDTRNKPEAALGASTSSEGANNQQQLNVAGQALNAVTTAIEAELNKNSAAVGELSKPLGVTASNTTAAAMSNVINKNIVGEDASGKQIGTSQSSDGAKVASESQIQDELLAKLASEDKRASRDISSQMASVLNTASPLGEAVSGSLLAENGTRVELGAVQLEKNVMQAKLETQTQIKHEVMIKENVLFNKQELAANVQQQVGMMLARNLKSIDIRLDPPELGSIKIKMQLNGEQAAVSFIVSNQQAKDALDNAMPKLKEMLEQQGMELADSDVKHEQSGQGGAEAGTETHDTGGQAEEGNDEHLSDASEVVVDIPSPYKVDYYA